MRCNTGIDPWYLTDQHLIAEYRELPMIIGSLRHNNWQVKSSIPEKLSLGKGHLNFWKNKLYYIRLRHELIKAEMRKRGFKCDNLKIYFDDSPYEFRVNIIGWNPDIQDTNILRVRIEEKLRMKPDWYRYYSKPIYNIDSFIHRMILSPLNRY